MKLLFIHGDPGLTADYLKPWFNILAIDHDLIFINQPRVSYKNLQADLANQIDTHKPDVLIAHSWGCHLTITTFYNYTFNLPAIFMAPMPLTDDDAKQGMARINDRMPQDDIEKLTSQISDQDFINLVTPYYHYNRDFDLKYSGKFDRSYAHAINQEIKKYDIRSFVSLLNEHTYIIYGDHDYIQHDPAYDIAIEKNKQFVISNAGHYMFAEQQPPTLGIIKACLKNIKGHND